MRKFKHKTIRRFRVGEFEFEDFILNVESDEKAEEFIKIVKTLPRRDALQIVEVNESAAADAEKSVVDSQDTIVRGAQTAADILTEDDKKRLQQQQGSGSAAAGASNPIAAGNKLAEGAAKGNMASAMAAINAGKQS